MDKNLHNVDRLPPLIRAYHEYGPLPKTGGGGTSNQYHGSRNTRNKGHRIGPAAIVNVGQEEEEPCYIYDRYARLKKL